MRITIPTMSFYPYPCSSGISNAVYFLSQVLAEKFGIRPTIIMPKFAGMKSMEEFENFRVERFDMIDIFDYTFSHRAIGMIKRQRPDLIHSFHYGYFPATAGFVAARKMHVPHLFTTAYHPSATWKRKLLWAYTLTQGVHILNKSNVVLPFNRHEMRNLSRYAKANFRIIPCPVDDTIFFPDRRERSKITLGYIGTMLPWKGPHIAMDICKQIEKESNDVESIFVGKGPMEKDIKKAAGEKFKFYKQVGIGKMAELYNSIDILISPTKYESFGYVLAEAAMCGTPVVSTRVGALPETVGPGGILADYGDWNSMKNAVSRLIDDSVLRRRLSKKAVKHSNKYKKKKVVAEIYKSYKKVLHDYVR